MKNYIKNYPRPQFVRNEWESLNGEWNFTFDDENLGKKKNIILAFQPEIKSMYLLHTKLN